MDRDRSIIASINKINAISHSLQSEIYIWFYREGLLCWAIGGVS